MTSNREILYWRSNEEWYTINEETGEFTLTEAATERARASFELLKKKKKIKVVTL
jgi:hypothetical protein